MKPSQPAPRLPTSLPLLSRARFPARFAPIAAGLACALLALACAGKFLPVPSEGQAAFATRSGTPSTVTSLDQGRDLFVMKCDKCHDLPVVQDHDPERWGRIMDKMKIQAELTPREDYLIRTYVVSSSAWLRDSLSIR